MARSLGGTKFGRAHNLLVCVLERPFPIPFIKKGKMPSYNRFVFTANNYTNDQIQYIAETVVPECSYIVFGKEVGESGTPHLQGFLKLKKKGTIASLRRLFGEIHPHFEVAKGSDEQASEYCKKDGNFEEFGKCKKERSRTDLEDFKEAVKGGMLLFEDIREAHSEVYARYPQFVKEYVMQYSPIKEVTAFPLRYWQQELWARLSIAPDDREIIFVVDRKGNSGKSWFCYYYNMVRPGEAQILTPGKKADMALMLSTGKKVLFLDCPRSKQNDFIQYDFLEEVKNGYICSPKYQSVMLNLPPMHVVCMMNHQPDPDKLSADRYVIIDVTDANNTCD